MLLIQLLHKVGLTDLTDKEVDDYIYLYKIGKIKHNFLTWGRSPWKSGKPKIILH